LSELLAALPACNECQLPEKTMFAQSRDDVRSHFISVWEKMADNAALEPLEQMLARVIRRHPEYHLILSNPDRALNTEFGVDGITGNPFLHMSLHVAIAEQMQTDRPPGVVKAYNSMLKNRTLDAHLVEHKMIDCLSASLWRAQRDSMPPDEAEYLACLTRSR
jgi:hypothetical protein